MKLNLARAVEAIAKGFIRLYLGVVWAVASVLFAVFVVVAWAVVTIVRFFQGRRKGVIRNGKRLQHSMDPSHV